MKRDQVTATIELLAAAELRLWVTGGWGIDALIGRQTRVHNDLDISVEDLDRTLAALTAAGFVVSVDWLPGRIVLTHPDGREIDVHPIVFAADGSALLTTWDGMTFYYPPDGFTTGTIGGEPVPCITASLQREFHSGYEPAAKDLADLQALDEAGL